MSVQSFIGSFIDLLHEQCLGVLLLLLYRCTYKVCGLASFTNITAHTTHTKCFIPKCYFHIIKNDLPKLKKNSSQNFGGEGIGIAFYVLQ